MCVSISLPAYADGPTNHRLRGRQRNAGEKKIHGAAGRYALITWVTQNVVDPVTQIERVASTYIYDSGGRQYLDLSSQLVNVNLGHGESIDWIKRRVLELGLEVRVSDHFIMISSQLSITAEQITSATTVLDEILGEVEGRLKAA